MVAKIKPQEAAARRETILLAARWCFLNFGFSKTSLDDIAKRANISRTLLYKTFKDKEDIFTAVFAHWLVSRHPRALAAAEGDGSVLERLTEVSRVMMVEPWSDMAGAPMAGDFYDVCERLDPEIAAHHRKVALSCLTTVLGDEASAEVFLLSLDGQLADDPAVVVLEKRIDLLAARFAALLQPGGGSVT